MQLGSKEKLHVLRNIKGKNYSKTEARCISIQRAQIDPNPVSNPTQGKLLSICWPVKFQEIFCITWRLIFFNINDPTWVIKIASLCRPPWQHVLLFFFYNKEWSEEAIWTYKPWTSETLMCQGRSRLFVEIWSNQPLRELINNETTTRMVLRKIKYPPSHFQLQSLLRQNRQLREHS